MRVGAWRATGSQLLLLLFGRSGRHQFVVIEAIPLAKWLQGQDVWHVAEADQLALVGHLFTQLNVHSLVEGTLPPQVVEVDLRQLVADRVVTLALLVKLFLNLGELGALD